MIGMDSKEKRRSAEAFKKHTKKMAAANPWTDDKTIEEIFAVCTDTLKAETVKAYTNAVKRFAQYCKDSGRHYPDAMDVKAFFVDQALKGVTIKSLEGMEYPALKKYSSLLTKQGGRDIMQGKSKAYFFGDIEGEEESTDKEPAIDFETMCQTMVTAMKKNGMSGTIKSMIHEAINQNEKETAIWLLEQL